MTATNPFNRPDTLLGICQAVGEDFGFHPNILRVAFALALFWSASWTFAAYGALGIVVLASRLLFPDASRAKVETPAAVETANDEHAIEFAEAA